MDIIKNGRSDKEILEFIFDKETVEEREYLYNNWKPIVNLKDND